MTEYCECEYVLCIENMYSTQCIDIFMCGFLGPEIIIPMLPSAYMFVFPFVV